MDEKQRAARSKERKRKNKLERQRQKEELKKKRKKLLANPTPNDHDVPILDPHRVGKSPHHFKEPVSCVKKEGDELKEKNKVISLKRP